MKITVYNAIPSTNKYVRLLKWKLYRLNRKFSDLIYADIFIKQEGTKNAMYSATVRLGIPGNDIILKHKASTLPVLIAATHKDARRYLARRSKSYRTRRGY